MILHCTQKLADKLQDISTTPLVEANPLGSWHAHLYTFNRRQCVLFCHDVSRYMLFLPGLVKTDFANLGQRHRDIFLASLATLGVKESVLNRVALSLGPVRFDRNTDRSVMGSLRVASFDLSCLLEDANIMDCDPLALSKQLNERPATVRGKWIFPDRVMQSLVEQLSVTTASSRK